MGQERLPALHVVALAKNPLSASQLASGRNATGLASAAATFVVARAKSSHQSSKHMQHARRRAWVALATALALRHLSAPAFALISAAKQFS
jgi:hypothetical protein